jgi:hypothetical protein
VWILFPVAQVVEVVAEQVEADHGHPDGQNSVRQSLAPFGQQKKGDKKRHEDAADEDGVHGSDFVLKVSSFIGEI